MAQVRLVDREAQRRAPAGPAELRRGAQACDDDVDERRAGAAGLDRRADGVDVVRVALFDRQVGELGVGDAAGEEEGPQLLGGADQGVAGVGGGLEGEDEDGAGYAAGGAEEGDC